jgi:hypothetical protein
MNVSSAVALTIVAALMVIVVTEIVAAVLPLILVVALVPRDERRDLAELLAAADSSRRLRLWPALRVAVAARRRQRLGAGRDGPPEPQFLSLSPPAASRPADRPGSPPAPHRAKD